MSWRRGGNLLGACRNVLGVFLSLWWVPEPCSGLEVGGGFPCVLAPPTVLSAYGCTALLWGLGCVRP